MQSKKRVTKEPFNTIFQVSIEEVHETHPENIAFVLRLGTEFTMISFLMMAIGQCFMFWVGSETMLL